MSYKVIKCDNYDIYLIKTNKFKTINISTILISDYKKEEITINKFISEYLVNSNEYAKDEVSMSKKYMYLYEPSISVNDFFSNEHHKIYSTTFLNEKYTEKGMNKKTIDFYYSILFNPNLDRLPPHDRRRVEGVHGHRGRLRVTVSRQRRRTVFGPPAVLVGCQRSCQEGCCARRGRGACGWWLEDD